MEEVKKTGLTFIDTRRLANISYKDIKNGFVRLRLLPENHPG